VSSVSSRMSRAIISALETDEGEEEARMELDSHADLPVLGIHANIIAYTGNYVTVSGFVDSLGHKKRVPIVDATIAYDCDLPGQTYLLYMCNALYIPVMKYHLIPPFAMCLAGLIVDECPKFLAQKASIANHSVLFPSHSIRIPLYLRGIVSYFPSRRPTSDELNDDSMLVLDLTPRASEWNPHDNKYSELEAAMIDYKGDIREQDELPRHQLMGVVSSESDVVLRGVNRCLDVSSFASDLQVVASVGIYDWESMKGSTSGETRSAGTNQVCGVKTSRKRGAVDPDELAELWRIGTDAAKRTLDTCTQLLVRSSQDPTLNKRFSTSDRRLRYNRISSNVFMDTFFTLQPERSGSKEGGTRSLRGFGCAQVFVTDFNHTHVVPLNKKGDVPFSVKHYFKNVGVPPAIICDYALEQVAGRAKKICDECDCDIRVLEKGTQWANRAERFVKIFKDVVVRDLKESNCPMVLWCYCLQRRSEINNATAADNLALEGTNPYTRMTGQTCDISNLCQFGWYDWVYFRDEKAAFPYPKEVLGRCLGPSKSLEMQCLNGYLLRAAS